MTKIGDIVLVPCEVVGIGQLVYTQETVLDLAPVEASSGERYANNVVRCFSVLAKDVVEQKERPC
jgi:hypothetical protein